MNARIYGRFSSKPQERGDSKRRQIEGAIKYAQKNDLTVIGQPFFDEGVSGKAGLNLEREFGRLLRESQDGDIILCESLDRLGRQSPFLLGKLIYDTTQRGITIITWTDGKVIDRNNIDTMETQFTVFTGAAVSHTENKRKMFKLNETTQAAYKAGAKGVPSGTLFKSIPKCFTWDGEKKVIGLDESKAAIIRRIFEMYADGIGKNTICKTLNSERVPTLYKSAKQVRPNFVKPWQESSVKHILKNEAFAGVIIIKGQRFTNIQLPKVVSRQLFDNVQLLMGRNSTRRGKMTGRSGNLLTGIGFCHHCGGALYVKSSGNKTCAPTYYYCCRNARLNMCPTPLKMINARILEIVFFANYFGGSPENMFAVENKGMRTRIEALKARIQKLDKAIAGLYDLVEEGDTEAKLRIGQRRTEKAGLEHELTQLKGMVTEDTKIPSMMDEISELMDFEGTETDRKKGSALLKSFVPRLEAKLRDNDIRKKLVNILPTVLSRVVVDCSNKTIQPFTKDGRELRLINLDSFDTSMLKAA